MKTKTVYQTDRAGMFQAETDAHESPLEPGVFHIPARAVLVPPPSTWPDGQWPRWSGREWELVTRPSSVPDAATKLRDFLAANPDVAKLVGQ
ncbi:phage tail protein [Burkholderia gladioli]|uniref:phage tail protein n=1 Tax=Burkholderia gladioli TaxID=28095 RepID=UPI000CFF961D|nr:phage tail protein [Burkholderia gladioli]MBU9155059.1 phage tail protein [Burkholderia gladioli]PRG48111.1 phage tail protein [Burkholderia gladioli]